MKRLGYLSLIALIVTVVWLALVIARQASAGPQNTFEYVLAF